jgi:DNA invertase Pin-like site-specific DNA recombinase
MSTTCQEGHIIAAIYARKSQDQAGIADEAKSVTRQVEHARAYAAQKGWTVDETHVYTDDAISGAEFQRRPAFLRLMNTLKPQPPFSVSIMNFRRSDSNLVGMRDPRASVQRG